MVNHQTGSAWGKTMGIYLLTTLFAISVGLIIAKVFNPGKVFDNQSRIENRLNKIKLQMRINAPDENADKKSCYNMCMMKI
jgi:Na+/H+-dicarboxylate symporter